MKTRKEALWCKLHKQYTQKGSICSIFKEFNKEGKYGGVYENRTEKRRSLGNNQYVGFKKWRDF